MGDYGQIVGCGFNFGSNANQQTVTVGEERSDRSADLVKVLTDSCRGLANANENGEEQNYLQQERSRDYAGDNDL